MSQKLLVVADQMEYKNDEYEIAAYKDAMKQ